MESWQFLLLGGLAAVGAALAIGTIAAWATYRRTGRFPGTPEDAAPGPVTTSQRVGLVVRVVVGLALAVWGVVSLVSADLL